MFLLSWCTILTSCCNDLKLCVGRRKSRNSNSFVTIIDNLLLLVSNPSHPIIIKTLIYNNFDSVCRVSSVCRLWNNVAADPSLWRVANLSGNSVRKFKKTFRWLCKHRLSRVREINLANWEVLTYKEIEVKRLSLEGKYLQYNKVILTGLSI